MTGEGVKRGEYKDFTRVGFGLVVDDNHESMRMETTVEIVSVWIAVVGIKEKKITI